MSEALSDIKIWEETNKVINIFASKVYYYEGRICSCVGANEG